ncbi:eight-cysteine-cluster domain-containing protein [Candidatus Woesearchaeota archaeon]|nr:eight-cysteine-cluster domain-containing protein [Candidatus Woesearchaeota archaeon]
MKGLVALLLVFIVGCTTIDNNPAGTLPEEIPTGEFECNVDSDCAVGGCSGQICARADLADDIITTCEYQEVYACYKLTSCGCVNNQCQWAQNQEFNNCLAKY